MSVKRRTFHLLVIGLLALLAVALVALTWHAPAPQVATTSASPAILPTDASSGEPVVPLPHSLPHTDPARVALGERLFHDAGLSADGSVSCSSCHPLELGGTDRRRVSLGVGGARGTFNAPTVFNTAFNIAQFWDGRAATLDEQVAGPLHNPAEMASSWARVIDHLSASADYRDAFSRVYPEGITVAAVTDAIVSFERSLLTPDAPFDRYLRGKRDAIGQDAIDGYARFKSYGCASCHQGVGIGGNMFQRFGIMGNYFADRGKLGAADLGRYNVTGRDEDRHVFKVPGLRNVALTPPYFHDGSIDTLDEAVSIMARYQLGREITAEDRRLIVAFLQTLTGRTPAPQHPAAAR